MGMEATSFAKPHFGLGLAHTPSSLHCSECIQVVPNNTPNAQIVVQLQTKFVKQFEQGLPLTSSSGLLIFSSGRP